MESQRRVEWPVPPEVADPRPGEQRRAWGKLSYEERYRRQRRDLLRAAAAIASRRGYQGARISDIVAEAGLSKGTFYEHFSSKEDCFLELYRTVNAGMIRSGISAAEQAFDHGPYETILAVCRALIGYVGRDPRLARVLGTEFGGTDPQIAAEWRQNLGRIVDVFVVVANRLGTALDEAEVRLVSEVLVQGVVAVLPELRRRGSGFDGSLKSVARLACRGFGLAETPATLVASRA